MPNAEEFIEKYKEFESAVRTTYRLSNEESIRNFLCQQPEFSRYQAEIVCCQETRNLLQHQPMIQGEYPVEPSGKLVEMLDFLTARVLDRKTCIDVCVKANNVFSVKLQDSVKGAMATMRAKHYSCIPVVDDERRVIGIFSEGSIFDYLADEGIVELSDTLSFEDLKAYIDPDGREGVLNLFLPHNYLVDKLVNRIESAANATKRFQVAIITNTGDRSEPMQGIVTPWDVIA
ncbi:MAG: CBS domain-containing protein [Eggerthellaceae bacterium]|nr:CBS domain-containing protein [Eggerthellaceae bacterium]